MNQPLRHVYLPEKHRQSILYMYHCHKLNRKCEATVRAWDQGNWIEVSNVRVTHHEATNHAVISVSSIGRDMPALLRKTTRDLHQQAIKTITLELPASHPAAPFICLEAEQLGYTWNGLAFEVFPSGDALCYKL